MADQNIEGSKTSSGCFGKMAEMMRGMMSKKGGSCCSCAEMMAEMMPGRCSAQNQEKNPVERPNQDAPK